MHGVKRALTLGAAVVVAGLCGCVSTAAPVWADAFGQIAHVGSYGAAEGQFQWPGDLAVDPTDNSAYVLDEPPAERPGFGPSASRIRKFSPGLPTAAAAEATIATPAVSEEVLHGVDAMAIDPALHRLYVLKTITTPFSESYVGSAIVAYSTQNSGKVLPLAPEVPEVEVAPGIKEAVFYQFPTPPTASPWPAGTLGTPHGLAVDPVTHDLIVLGSDETGNTLLQRIHASGPPYSTGTLTNSFDDTTTSVDIRGSSASGVAVGPDGSIYLSTLHVAGAADTGVMKLTADFSTVSVLHADERVETELTGGLFEAGVDNGPQIAVSPDGSLVYAAETHQPELGGAPRIAGSYAFRAMSTTDGSQQFAFGGAPTNSGSCLIASRRSAIAAGSAGVVYVLDEGYEQGRTENGGHTEFGFQLIEFGPGGSGCPEPSTSFTINENAEAGAPFKVEKGTEAKFAASNSGLNGAEPTELEWKIEGPEPETKVIATGCPATCLSTKHWFFKPGSYKVALNMKVTKSALGSPPTFTRSIEVFAPPPTASFEASAQSVKPGEPVSFNGEGSLDPAGSCEPEVGCKPTNHLKSYTWSFGDGQTETTTSTQYNRTFANPGTEARSETVMLTVTNEEGVQSTTPATQTLTVQGTPASGGGGGGQTSNNGGGIPLTNNPISQVSGVIETKQKPLTNAQKLTNALRTCKKMKPRKRRSSCEKQAKKQYGPKRRPRKKSGARRR